MSESELESPDNIMVANERIMKKNANIRRLLAWEGFMDDCHMNGRPASMFVTYHDGAGIQFSGADGKPLLPALIYDEELAITIWNALTDSAPIDPAWFK